MSPAIVAVIVLTEAMMSYHGSGIWAAPPDAIHTTIVSPTARMTPRMSAASTPLAASAVERFGHYVLMVSDFDKSWQWYRKKIWNVSLTLMSCPSAFAWSSQGPIS